MKNSDFYVSKKIIKKSNSYLKIAIGMFLVVSIFIITTGIIYIQQYYGLNRNFFDNKAVHTINVSSYSNENGIVNLEAIDCRRISQLLSSVFPNEDFQVIPVYTTCTGILDSEGNMYKLYGIASNEFDIVGNIDVKENTIYFLECAEKSKHLEILNYQVVDDGGMISKESSIMEINYKSGVSSNSPILIFDNIQSETLIKGFVEEKTFLRIAQLITGSSSEIIDEFCGSGLIEFYGIFIDIEDLGEVENFAEILKEYGYSTMCTFDAFEGFGDYFEETIWIVGLFGVFVLLISIFLMFGAFNSYYRMQQKEMGILKYYGFNEKRIFDIYVNGLRIFFILNGVVLAVYTISLSYILRILSHWREISLLIAFICAILMIIYHVLKCFVIKKYIQKDILFLLKKSKEIE